VALDKEGVSHFQLLQNALRHEAKLRRRAVATALAYGLSMTVRFTLAPAKKQKFRHQLPS
jgi:hypothetical protein